ncbi:MAG: hypothetical protein GXP36_04180 [Actinobacteria bacterium]|nr:hypothetical protein [Actinomycetota bacterium]
MQDDPQGPDEGQDPSPTIHTRQTKDPARSLKTAMLAYIVVNTIVGLPLLVFPISFLDAVGFDRIVADQLGGIRWVGAVLVAWAVGSSLVIAQPEGRATLVTTGALQMTFAAFTFLWTLSTGEKWGSSAFHLGLLGLFSATALLMWAARFRARKVFKGLASPG